MKLRILLSKFITIEKAQPNKSIVKEEQKEEHIEYRQSPRLPKYTQNQIRTIHNRGKITADEKVTEWERIGLCAAGEKRDQKKTRCEKFNHNCHECLIELASDRKEYKSKETIEREALDTYRYNIYDQVEEKTMVMKKEL